MPNHAAIIVPIPIPDTMAPVADVLTVDDLVRVRDLVAAHVGRMSAIIAMGAEEEIDYPVLSRWHEHDTGLAARLTKAIPEGESMTGAARAFLTARDNQPHQELGT